MLILPAHSCKPLNIVGLKKQSIHKNIWIYKGLGK